MTCPEHGVVETERATKGNMVVDVCSECGRTLRNVAHVCTAA